jgi:hypothetical protein
MWFIVLRMSNQKQTPEVKAIPDRLLMSRVLEGNVPELEGDSYLNNHEQPITVIAGRYIAGNLLPFVGVLKSILFNSMSPEIEFKVELDEAFAIVEADDISFSKFELHYGERIVPVVGPFLITDVRISDIDTKSQMCSIHIGLKRVQRTTL